MSSIGCRHWGWVAALAAAALIVGIATPAQARDEFEYAFRVELGRIAAHEAVYAGKHILGAVLHGGHYPRASYGYQSHGYPRHHHYYDDCDRHGYGHHYRHHGRHDGHYRSRGHRGRRH